MNNIEYKKSIKIITTNNKKLVYKRKNKNKQELFNYLKNKNFNNYLEPINVTDTYEIYKYIDDKTTKEEKENELINIMSMLHIKTTSYQKIDKEKIEKLYNQIKDKIIYLQNYYLDLQDYFESKIIPSPAAQLYLVNASKFHKALRFSLNKLESWYKEKNNQTIERIVQLHNNLSLEHLLKEDKYYLISWGKEIKDYVIYDFINFYKNEYLNIELYELFEKYQNKYKYTKDEKLLFESLISIPEKILFNKSNFENVVDVRRQIDYIEKTNLFLLKNYEKNQESNNHKMN